MALARKIMARSGAGGSFRSGLQTPGRGSPREGGLVQCGPGALDDLADGKSTLEKWRAWMRGTWMAPRRGGRESSWKRCEDGGATELVGQEGFGSRNELG